MFIGPLVVINDDVKSEFSKDNACHTSWNFSTLLITLTYNPWCKGNKCNVLLLLTLSLWFSDTFMPVSIIKLSSGTYIFQILTSYVEMTDTFLLRETPIMTFILSC